MNRIAKLAYYGQAQVIGRFNKDILCSRAAPGSGKAEPAPAPSTGPGRVRRGPDSPPVLTGERRVTPLTRIEPHDSTDGGAQTPLTPSGFLRSAGSRRDCVK
jgi:hypothetical protein